MELAYLAEEQNVAFDAEYHSLEELDDKVRWLRERFPDGPRTILDVGGGNGKFLDYLLDAFPQAQGYLLDVSELLLKLNKPHPRKTLIQASIDQADAVLAGRTFDLITMNWLLHHLVGPTHEKCGVNCVSALEMCRRHLAPGGALIVGENLFEGYAGLNLPSHIIFAITRIKFPFFVKLARRFFNTAGVGVCFRNETDWGRVLARAFFKPQRIFYRPWPHPKGVNGVLMRFLGLSSRGHGHFFCVTEKEGAAR